VRGGVITDGVLSFEIVLADGRLLSTGSAFFRPFGPDLTGLFAADTGALGVKATVTLQLVREGSALGYGSYSLSDRGEFFYCDERAARAGVASESFGFDPFLQCQRLKRESVLTDARSLLAVMKQQLSTWNALKEGARLAAAGRSFLDEGSSRCISFAKAVMRVGLPRTSRQSVG
jgi:hypothetical protein